MLDLASLQNSLTLNAFCLRLDGLTAVEREILLSDRDRLMRDIVEYPAAVLNQLFHFVN